MKYFVFTLLIFLGHQSYGQEMRIGLLRTLQLKSITLQKNQGAYTVYGDTINLGQLEKLKLTMSGSDVKCIAENGETQLFSKILIVQDSVNSEVELKAIQPVSKVHHYRNNIEITNEGNRLKVINLVDMNNYLAGVLESEGGGGRNVEYYKVQALMSRTYAMKHSNRHAKEKFQLCDGVHCQAYHNKLKHTPTIQLAVEQTSGEVIIDQNNNLVNTYFSANCGGQTCDAEYIWNTSDPNLSSFTDTFCVRTKQANWIVTIEKERWSRFLAEEFGITEKAYGSLIYNFDQNQRKAFFIHPSLGIPLRDLRVKFKLKSTYFSTRLVGGNVVIQGRGFGHGVGLCQEGAMEMAKQGYSYRQIAHFYFNEIKIVDYFRLQFFKQEGEFEMIKQ